MALAPRPAPSGLNLFDRLRHEPAILDLIARADDTLADLGYTDHGRRHVTLVGTNAARILDALGYDQRACDLAAVAGLLHDIGNVSGREGHAATGATMAYRLLVDRGIPQPDALAVYTAIANHDEVEGGEAKDAPTAALIVADKADIHRSRVRTRDEAAFDVHDRVNYAVTRSALGVDVPRRRMELTLVIDSRVAGGREVSELFAARFAMSADASAFLGCSYVVDIQQEDGA